MVNVLALPKQAIIASRGSVWQRIQIAQVGLRKRSLGCEQRKKGGFSHLVHTSIELERLLGCGKNGAAKAVDLVARICIPLEHRRQPRLHAQFDPREVLFSSGNLVPRFHDCTLVAVEHRQGHRTALCRCQ